ncbi:hypothetical protein GCM10023149_23070 [Mucilaginibacter gynuensis]|uniref:Chitinase n=1 Tax=Mucilaginibacter gynuensis TaxID=1302236 RepID=A0ABP8GDY8_9SPHI
MAHYIVTATVLNKRRSIPASLPDDGSIVEKVAKGFEFDGQEVDVANVPNPSLGKWYQDAAGFFYSGSGVVPFTSAAPVTLDAAKIKAATGSTLNNAQKFLPYITAACTKYHINTPIRQLCFLAQLGHESAGLFFTEELASGRAYEGRTDLGNTHPGDGIRYKGRGLIQITGRGNYQWLGTDFGEDFVNNPPLLGGKNIDVCSPQQLKYAALSAGWFWNNRALNAIADNINIHTSIEERPNLDHFKLITRKINGGYNGLSDRVSRYKNGVAAFV